MNTIVLYERNNAGILIRHAVPGISKEEHLDYYEVGPVTDYEVITGWPERAIEWHGIYGYGIPFQKEIL